MINNKLHLSVTAQQRVGGGVGGEGGEGDGGGRDALRLCKAQQS